MISKKMYTPAFAKKKNIQGSTLVEVIVSVILLTLGLLALMATQLRSVSGLTEAENRSISRIYANEWDFSQNIKRKLLS